MAYTQHTTDKLNSLSGVQVMLDEPLSRHTTLKIGGPAAALVVVDSEAALTQVVSICKSDEVRYSIIGGGSNLLCPDEGYEGVVIKLGDGFKSVAIATVGQTPDIAGIVTVGAGLLLRKLVTETLAAGLVGAQSFAGIPGTVGGALRMNAGVGPDGVGSFVRTITVFNPETAQLRTLAASEIAWNYRSGIPEELGIVTSATFIFEQGDVEIANSEIARALEARRAKQPYNLPNAGSVFKNPPEMSAGALIESCGLKGFSVGGAQVSLLHANFIVNTGSATAADVITLVTHIIEVVNLRYGIKLEQEIKTLK